MKLINLIKSFGKNEEGAVTVDWVVLTAAVVGLGILAVSTISGSIGNVSSVIADSISDAQSAANSN